jgi:hypothetical protein
MVLVKHLPHDAYVKQVSTSSYGSIDLPSGNNITTIQKRISLICLKHAASNPKKKSKSC